jgi:hypothetical protein
MLAWLEGFVRGLFGLLVALAAGYAAGKGKAEKERLKDEVDQAKKGERKWADADTVPTPDRLQRLADNKRKRGS